MRHHCRGHKVGKPVSWGGRAHTDVMRTQERPGDIGLPGIPKGQDLALDETVVNLLQLKS